MRAAHYLSQAQADFIWANDACRFLAPTIFQNLSLFAATAVAPMTDCPPAMRSSQEEDTCAAGHANLGSLVLPQLSLAQVKVFTQEPEEQKIEKLPPVKIRDMPSSPCTLPDTANGLDS
jgi:hypothetical protein